LETSILIFIDMTWFYWA